MKKARLIIAVCIFFVGVGAVLALYIMPKINETKEVSNELETAEKPVIKRYACWAWYDFERAVDEAATIVHGKVKSIGNTQVHETPTSFGEPLREYYKEVTVEVLEAMKGVNVEETTITYIEHGGETDNAIYIYEGLNPVAIGEEYIFFLTERGVFLSPWTLMPVSDGVVETWGLIPSEVSSEQQAYTKDTPHKENLEQYITAIREELAE